MLVAHRHSGERDRKHQHYLKGTIRCGTCGSQLVYSCHNGNGGIYEYFVCPRNQRGECPQGYQPIDLVEQRSRTTTPASRSAQAEREQVRKAITERPRRARGHRPAGDRAAARPSLTKSKSRSESCCTCTTKSASAANCSTTSKPASASAAKTPKTLIARLSVRYDDIAATLDLALKILGDDLHELYRRADDTIRRLINQAIFNALYVCDETITEAEFAEPFAALRALHTAIRGLPASPRPLAERRRRRQHCPADAKGPDPYRGREPFRVGSISASLVRTSGLEPPPCLHMTRPSTSYAREIRSARVQIVRFVRDRGRIGHIGRNDLCQRCATPKLCQVDQSPCRASQCRTRFRTEHSFDSVFAWPSSLRGEAAHRQSPACHNDRREAEAAGSTTPGGARCQVPLASHRALR